MIDDDEYVLWATRPISSTSRKKDQQAGEASTFDGHVFGSFLEDPVANPGT